MLYYQLETGPYSQPPTEALILEFRMYARDEKHRTKPYFSHSTY